MLRKTQVTRKVSYPTREEIINALKEDDLPKGFNQFYALIELYKKSENLFLIKGELFEKDEVILRGKFTIIPENKSKPTQWDEMEIGESKIMGFSLEYLGETLFDIIKEGFRESLGQGRIPFIS